MVVNFIRSVERTGHMKAGGNEDEPNGIAFNESGTRMFLVESGGNNINQYTLSEGFNISTASFDGGVQASISNPNGIAFSH